MERLLNERGSIPLAMLAIIAVGAVASVLTATMVGGQRHTRFDQSDEQSLQLAEVAMDRMAAQIITRQATASFTLPASADSSGTATRTTDGWTLSATGVAADGTRRTVQGVIRDPSIFRVAAFGRVGLEYGGANRVDAYRSGTWSGFGPTQTFTPAPVDHYLDANNTVMSSTGKGHIGTNGRLLLKGSAISVIDAAVIFNAREHVANPLPGATGFCAGVTVTCDARRPECVSGQPCLLYVDQPFEFPEVVLPSAPVGAFNGRNGNVLPAGVSVFTSAYLDSTTVIQGTPTNPSIVFLTGQLSIPSHALVNFTSGGAPLRQVPRPSPSLRIYSSSEGTALSLGSHAQISAGIYAPKGAFGGGSQGQFWGSMVTNSIDNNGGAQFHYDESLAEVDDVSPLFVESWVETAPTP